ncbi:MAG: glucuronate isomerase [Treponema sp.]|jgi:glucuronate isomerase|nr:glucuronate isomerase [Treponema sp.]
MAKPFMDNDFLLGTQTARSLFNAVKNEPVYDYHCHLPLAQIAENRQFKDIAEAWLAGDHYKWRMMRALGIDEYYITGDAGGYEKFLAWARTVENLPGNPLYHWTHLELQRYFEIYEPLTETNAAAIWEKANALLQKREMSVKGIFEKFNVYAVGTTDDPADSLEHHRSIAEGSAPIGRIETKVIPTFRPDKALNINSTGFADYIGCLSRASGIPIESTEDVLAALEKRLDFFAATGCRASDHGLEYAPFADMPGSKIEKCFRAAMKRKPVSQIEADAYKTKILTSLAKLYAQRGIAMQLHIGALRNVNTRLFLRIGADAGIDAVNDRSLSGNLAALLDRMESESKSGVPKTIIYSANPRDYYPIATIMGGFQDNRGKEENRTGIEGKIQFGSAWWFCDHKDGIEEQMRILAAVGMLPVFTGMVTDSRSFLSYPRHEYFRRILCNLIGKWVENGEYPSNTERLVKIARDISFENAKRYFGAA